MTTVLATATQAAAPYQQVAKVTGLQVVVGDGGVTDRPGVDKPTTDRPGTTTGKSTTDRPGVTTGTDRTSGTGSQTDISISAGSTSMSSGWFWGFAILFSATVGFGIWYFSKRKK